MFPMVLVWAFKCPVSSWCHCLGRLRMCGLPGRSVSLRAGFESLRNSVTPRPLCFSAPVYSLGCELRPPPFATAAMPSPHCQGLLSLCIYVLQQALSSLSCLGHGIFFHGNVRAANTRLLGPLTCIPLFLESSSHVTPSLHFPG